MLIAWADPKIIVETSRDNYKRNEYLCRSIIKFGKIYLVRSESDDWRN